MESDRMQLTRGETVIEMSEGEYDEARRRLPDPWPVVDGYGLNHELRAVPFSSLTDGQRADPAVAAGERDMMMALLVEVADAAGVDLAARWKLLVEHGVDIRACREIEASRWPPVRRR